MSPRPNRMIVSALVMGSILLAGCSVLPGKQGSTDAPTAEFEAVCEELTCRFIAVDDTSYAQDVIFEWDLGDGSYHRGADLDTIKQTYADPGTYQVSLNLTDNDESLARSSQSINVSVEPPSVGTPETLWSFPLPNRGDRSPVVADGLAYAWGSDDHLYALDAADGSQRWRVHFEGIAGNDPVVADDVAYVTLHGTDGDGTGLVAALDTTDGSELWTFPTPNWIYAPPTVADGVVYAATFDMHMGDTFGTLYAVDATAGTELWSVTLNAGSEAAPVVAGGTVYVGHNDRELRALDATDGSELWQVDMNSDYVRRPPVVVDGIVYVSVDGLKGSDVRALDATDGTQLWRFDTEAIDLSRPVVADGVTYVTSHHATDADVGGTLFALDKSDGSEHWRAETDRQSGSLAVIEDGAVYVTFTNFGRDDYPGEVMARNTEGEPLWRFATHAWSVSAPVVQEGIVFVGTRGDVGNPDGIVYAIDAVEGSEVWRFQTENDQVPPPGVAGDIAYVTTRDAVIAFYVHGDREGTND